MLIPYGHRPDLTGLQNGEIYRVEAALEILEDFSTDSEDEKGYGGLGSSSTSLRYFALCIPLLVGLTYLLIKKQKRISH